MHQKFTVRLVPDRLAIALSIPGILLPAIVTFAIALRTSINIPNLDDYHAALQFIDVYATQHGVLTHLGTILTWQHNQYKLIFGSALYAAEYDLSGHLNFALLQWLGNLFIFAIALLLWRISRPRHLPFAQRLLLFVPIALLFFAPQYEENINWTMSALQHNPCIFFSLLAILLLARNQAAAFTLACVSLLLAIAASGNGFFLALVGLAFLLQLRRLRWAVLWSVVTLVMAAVYATHFHPGFLPDRPPIPHPTLTLLLYPFAFLGASATYVGPSTVAGLLLVPLFFFLLWRAGGFRAAPIPGYIGVFLLITAAAVSVVRHTFGLYTAMAPRYRMYSILFIILVYSLLAELALRSTVSVRRLAAALALVTVASLAFNLQQDRFAAGSLWTRKILLTRHLQRWIADPRANSVEIDEYPGLKSPENLALARQANSEMRYAIDHRLYIPPRIPPDAYDHDLWFRHRPALKP